MFLLICVGRSIAVLNVRARLPRGTLTNICKILSRFLLGWRCLLYQTGYRRGIQSPFTLEPSSHWIADHDIFWELQLINGRNGPRIVTRFTSAPRLHGFGDANLVFWPWVFRWHKFVKPENFLFCASGSAKRKGCPRPWRRIISKIIIWIFCRSTGNIRESFSS